jgi:hypothetical protein
MSDPHQGAPGSSPRRSRTSRDAAQFESRSRP